MQTTSFTHPEKKYDELFISNVSHSIFNSTNLNSKRLGKSSFDGQGNRIYSNDWFPMFVKSKELDTYNISLGELRLKIRMMDRS